MTPGNWIKIKRGMARCPYCLKKAEPIHTYPESDRMEVVIYRCFTCRGVCWDKKRMWRRG